MKSYTIITTIILSLLLASCSGSNKLARNEMEAQKGEEVKTALESQKFVIRLDRTSTRRGGQIYLNNSHNYLVINGEKARMNLAYIGRSMDARGISGINMAGKVTERSLTPKKRGSVMLSLTLEQEAETFDVKIDVSKSGRCSVSVYHPRLDPISYRGDISSLNSR